MAEGRRRGKRPGYPGAALAAREALHWGVRAILLFAGLSLARRLAGRSGSGEPEQAENAENAEKAGEKGRKDADRVPDPESLEAHRERKDMGHLWVAVFGGVLIVGLAALLAVLWGLQSALGHPPAAPGLRASAMPHAGDSAAVERFRARAPGLFPDPEGDLRRWRAAQAARAPPIPPAGRPLLLPRREKTNRAGPLRRCVPSPFRSGFR